MLDRGIGTQIGLDVIAVVFAQRPQHGLRIPRCTYLWSRALPLWVVAWVVSSSAQSRLYAYA